MAAWWAAIPIVAASMLAGPACSDDAGAPEPNISHADSSAFLDAVFSGLDPSQFSDGWGSRELPVVPLLPTPVKESIDSCREYVRAVESSAALRNAKMSNQRALALNTKESGGRAAAEVAVTVHGSPQDVDAFFDAYFAAEGGRWHQECLAEHDGFTVKEVRANDPPAASESFGLRLEDNRDNYVVYVSAYGVRRGNVAILIRQTHDQDTDGLRIGELMKQVDAALARFN